MNKGIKAATGDYINFMNAGDEFVDNDVIQKIAECMVGHNCSVLYGDAIHRYSFGERILKSRPLKDIRKCMPFSHQSCFVMRNLFFNTKYRYAADYDMLFHLYLKHSKFLYLNFPIASVLVEEGMTASNFGKSKREVRKIQIENGISYLNAYKTFIIELVRFYTMKIIKLLVPSSIKRWLIKRKQ